MPKDQIEDCGHGKPNRLVTIIVNGRPKEVEKGELTWTEVIKLAFENPPQGELICFTVTYRRGRGNRPDGTLDEGESVKVKERMVFNVTVTDKS